MPREYFSKFAANPLRGQNCESAFSAQTPWICRNIDRHWLGVEWCRIDDRNEVRASILLTPNSEVSTLTRWPLSKYIHVRQIEAWDSSEL